MAKLDQAAYLAELTRKYNAATRVVDRCRKCGQTSTTFAGHAAPSSCWGKLPNGRSCNGKAFDRTTKAAKARPAAAAATARRPAASAAASRKPAPMTPAQRTQLAYLRAAFAAHQRANVERDREARVRHYLLTGNY